MFVKAPFAPPCAHDFFLYQVCRGSGAGLPLLTNDGPGHETLAVNRKRAIPRRIRKTEGTDPNSCVPLW